ncbi:hypothetical protein [Thioalkalivibrio thiocyanodenitrificans]|uniref:hypothetical protein n=1 Tax=Thioalkalivibrio thiocyanodenitrificans TaxID=243063 RepID=UPI0003775EA4|nr:hypothetical protein [Thioalkalivibrio thiocyanodenitrificans]
MYKASIDTPNWGFEAYGNTEAEAREALKQGWQRHVSQTGDAAPGYLEEFEEDIMIQEVAPGMVFRDLEPL